MRSQPTFALVVAFIAAQLSAPATASPPGGAGEACPASEWLIETAVDAWNVGRHLDVATDPETGNTFISYYDSVNGDLYLARTGAPGPGNCGPSNAWQCQILDSTGDVGQFNSIAVGGEGPIAMVRISYYDATNASLKFVRGNADRLTGGFSFSVHTIDSGNAGNNLFKGKHTAIALDPAGFAHIAYQVSNLFSHIDEAQIYARQVDPGTGNCGEGSMAGEWQCDVIFNDEGVGEFAAIDLLDYQNATIAFLDGDRGYPVVATYVASGGNCGPSNSWLCRTVEHTTYITGKHLSLFVEPTGVPHIAYYNETDESLEYATFVGSGGNCGFSSVSLEWEWQCDWIDDVGSSLTAMGIAIEEDANGHPVIAYQDATSPVGPAALKVARPYDATDWNPTPNCGPIDLFHTWVCEMLDTGGADQSEADAVAMTVNSYGEVWVAYRELNTYFFPPEGSVKVAFEPPFVFRDGFESGDTSRWTVSVP